MVTPEQHEKPRTGVRVRRLGIALSSNLRTSEEVFQFDIDVSDGLGQS